ncbi:MAG: T9SS type A sorting domain-containing protein, partial [Chitinophagaceae bacterium]
FTPTVTGLAAGTYNYIVYDLNGCGLSFSVDVGSPLALASSTTQVNTTCGNSNGSTTVNVTGGTAPYSYSWSSSAGTTQTVTGLAAGSYTCTVTDANGCSITTSTVNITGSSSVAATSTQTNVLCNGGATGTATVVAAGGTAPYTYSWSTGGTAATVTGLNAGTHTCTITDAGGCSTIISVIITEPAALAVTGSATNVSCFGATNGIASVVATGGTAPYNYSWSPAGGSAASTTGLPAGSYTCTVTDANGCISSQTVTIGTPTEIVATITGVDLLCYGSSTGSASVVVSGGSGTYTYAWSPSGGTGATATGLSAGLHTVVIDDGTGCSINRSVTITEPAELIVTGTSVDESCVGLADGSVTVTANGGTGTYTYTWLPSVSTTATATGLSAGTYTVTVTDDNGCQSGQTFILTGKPVPTVDAITGESICNAASSAGFTFGGSVVPSTIYHWTNNDVSIGLSASGSGNITPFVSANPGTVPVTATISVIPEANGCYGLPENFTIEVRPTPTVNAIAHQVLCDGEISSPIILSGAIPGTIYNWTNSSTEIGLAASGTNIIPAFNATNLTSSALAATISISPEFNGCTGPAETFNIKINTVSIDPVSIISSGSEICGPGTVNLSVNGGSLGLDAEWKWYSGSCGGTPVGTGSTLSGINVNTTTSYFVRAEGVCNITSCITTTVNVNPKPTVVLSAIGYLSLLPGMTTKLLAIPSPSTVSDSFTWYRNGVEFTGLFNPAYDVNVGNLGTYSVKLTTLEGCEVQSNEIQIKDSISNRSYILPNPNNGMFKVRHFSPPIFYGKRHLTIYNARGELVYRKVFQVNTGYTEMDINIMGVTRGMYILVIGDANNRVMSREKVEILW